jgi:hypothetical protein
LIAEKKWCPAALIPLSGTLPTEVRGMGMGGQCQSLDGPAFAAGQIGRIQAREETRNLGTAILVAGIGDLRTGARRIGLR